MTFLMLRRLLNAEASSVLVCMLQATPAVDWICVAQAFSVSNRRNTPMDPSESILVLQQAVACLAAENRRSEHDYTDLRGVAGITA